MKQPGRDCGAGRLAGEVLFWKCAANVRNGGNRTFAEASPGWWNLPFDPLGPGTPAGPARNQYMIVECGYVRDFSLSVDPGNDGCLAYDEDPVTVVVANPRVFDFVAGSLSTTA